MARRSRHAEVVVVLQNSDEDDKTTEPDGIEPDDDEEEEEEEEEEEAAEPLGFEPYDGEEGDSEPEGFDSYDEEEYQNKRDPFEDGAAPQLPGSSEPQAAPLQPPASPPTPQPAPLSWKTDKDPDIAPHVSTFQPARTPGPQLSSAASCIPLNLFKLFFPVQTVQTLCRNTNKQAARQMAQGKKYKWTDLDVEDFYKYIGMLLYMSMVKLDRISDYWRQNHLLSLPLPSQIMARDRYRSISWNLHLSDPDKDVGNDRKKGTAHHDKLFRLKPLMDTIKSACKTLYHPHRDLTVDERMVAPKPKAGMSQYIKAKFKKWGFKLFVLADSKNGYTVDFSVYTGKGDVPPGRGLSYDVVTSLVQAGYLGTGYHIYMDSFFSSPKLFRDLHESRFAACGTYRENRRDCPRTGVNALTEESDRGSVRWIRDGPVVYVKWMDTREVCVCSTAHTAHSSKTVQRRLKQPDGSWTKESVPCPTPVAEYNEHMCGADRPEPLMQYYSAQHKSMCWYRNLFYHFLDIATTNSFILHRELCLAQKTQPMTHRAFMEELTAELCGKPLRSAPARAPAGHLPEAIADVHAAGRSARATMGRRRCEHCHRQGRRKVTPWKCRECDVCLCLQLDRNCFAAWHDS